MGWSSGTYVCIDTWNAMREYVSEKDRPVALSKLVVSLQRQDWDCVMDIEDMWWPETGEALKMTLGREGE